MVRAEKGRWSSTQSSVRWSRSKLDSTSTRSQLRPPPQPPLSADTAALDTTVISDLTGMGTAHSQARDASY